MDPDRKWRLFAWQRVLQSIFQDESWSCCYMHQAVDARRNVKLAEYVLRRVQRQYLMAERAFTIDDRIA